MRYLIDYFRQAFCKHDWLIEEHKAESNIIFHKEGVKVYMRCKTCGYYKSHWKYI